MSWSRAAATVSACVSPVLVLATRTLWVRHQRGEGLGPPVGQQHLGAAAKLSPDNSVAFPPTCSTRLVPASSAESRPDQRLQAFLP
jgi:hypothetical protein